MGTKANTAPQKGSETQEVGEQMEFSPASFPPSTNIDGAAGICPHVGARPHLELCWREEAELKDFCTE